VQTCDASQIQTIPNRNNTAVVLQVIMQAPPGPGLLPQPKCLLKSMLMSARLERHLGPDCGCGCGMA
jgi:hypothetical protein